MKTSGIYKISNTITNDFYIGSSIDITNRWKQHRYELNNNKHHSKYLQNAWNKYGADNFKFEIIEVCEAEKLVLLETEQRFIDTLNPSYNFCSVAGSPLGSKRSEETKKRISMALKGHSVSEETKIKLRAANMGKTISEEHANKLRTNFKGKTHTESTKQKISQAQQGEKAPNVRLTTNDVLEIRKRYEHDKITWEQLALLFNVSKSCIQKIIQRQTWNNI